LGVVVVVVIEKGERTKEKYPNIPVRSYLGRAARVCRTPPTKMV